MEGEKNLYGVEKTGRVENEHLVEVE